MEYHQTLRAEEVKQKPMERLLRPLDVWNVTGFDDVSQQVLRLCSNELIGPLTEMIEAYVQKSTWPSIWKLARVAPVHKKEVQI